jgi:SAM-dependent methyltransferase
LTPWAARGVGEHRARFPRSSIHFECIDHDPHAIEYANGLLAAFDGAVTFRCENAFKLRAAGPLAELVWCAGLFDYLDDATFGVLCRRLMQLVAPTGSLVIGNFSPYNPTRAYMEFGEWRLHHRTEDELLRLAAASGARPAQCWVGREPEGINLFLHIRAQD